MKIRELFFPKNVKFRDREIHQTEADVHPDELKSVIHDLLDSGKDYGSILRHIDFTYGPDARYYAKKYISTNLNEECWSVPDDNKKISALKQLMTKPLPAKHASNALYNIIGTSDFHDMLESMAGEDPYQDSRQAIHKYISTAYPELEYIFTGKQDSDVEGIMSPLGNKEE